jgi:hypothetical protein
MRKIVDRNYLQSPKLRHYLAVWRKHRVVLTDYAAMEAFKGDALANIASATEILREFPKQVIVLKSTSSIGTLKGRRCGFTCRMIDRDQTRVFPEWCEHTARALAGEEELQRQIVENGIDADAYLKRMDEQENYAENLDAMAKTFSETELKALRKHEPISEKTFSKIQSHVLTWRPFCSLPTPVSPICRQQRNYHTDLSFAMRWLVIWSLRWISVGCAKNVKPEKIRNDIVDCTYAAYATYFQGLLSDDAGANEIYADTKFLVGLFLATPPPPNHILRRARGNALGVRLSSACKRCCALADCLYSYRIDQSPPRLICCRCLGQ